MRTFARWLLFVLICIGVAPALSGCSASGPFDVSGRVTYNTLPLNKPGGEIVFVGPEGSQIVSTIEQDGTFRARRVPAGLNRVAVYYRSPGVGSQPAKGQPRGDKSATYPTKPFVTPMKYASVDTSELSIEVEAGITFDVNLMGPDLR